MRGAWSTRLLAVAAATLGMLCMHGAAAQAVTPPAGLGDQLFATGGDITVEVLPGGIAGFTSELRLYDASGTFTKLATNRETGRVVTLPSRPVGEELVFGIYVVDTRNTFKIGPGDRNPDNVAHAVVKKTGERQFDVGFEDLFDGGDRDYDDNVFRFTGGLAPNRAPVADDQALTVAQGGSLPVTLTATDAEGDKLTYSISDPPLHGTLSGSGTAVTYVPAAGFSGFDTFAFSAADAGASDEGRVTIEVTAVKTPTPTPPKTGGSGRVDLGDCPFGEVTLVNVRRIGTRVLLTGLAQPTLAGAPVDIIEGGVVITRTTIGRDGAFSTRVRVPASRGGRVLRYQARLGALRSRNLRLRRRMVTTSARLRGGKIVFSGRVVGVKLRTRPVAVLYARPRGCGPSATYRRIGSARIGRDGRFSVRGKPLPGVAVAVYRVRAKLPLKIVSFTLPQAIAGR
ncbi:MAG: hypothetical protein QOG56_2056 [Solirubrobacteraceae bacterium]|nr:hypothetical protein [Solirubrobacteraceae bacterium]